MKLHHRIHAHIAKNHKKYLLGTGLAGAGFFAVKALIFSIGVLGIINHGGTFAQVPELELNSTNIVSYGCATNASSCDLSSLGFTSIATNTFINHTSLQDLQLGSNYISSIESGDFAGLNNLTSLYFQTNNIISINSGTFAGMHNLAFATLTRNEITSIETDAFAELPHLTTLLLGSNHLPSIEADDFVGPTNLQTLNLDNNIITSIESGDFAELSSLTTLDLSYNQISSIEANAFVGLDNLQQLALYYNQLTSIGANDFIGLPNLTGLYLNNNQISSIETGAFVTISGLTTLYIESNLLSTLSESATGLTNLALGQIYLNSNCRNTGAMSSDLLTFIDTKVGNTSRQTSINPSCPALPVDPTLPTGTGVCDQVTDISSGECLALIDFYNSTSGANRTTGTNRGTTGTACRSGEVQEGRYGVDCSCNRFDQGCETTTGGMVKRLNLQGNNLSGSIPSSLTGLGGLRWLSLGYNNITSLPDNIGGLINLVGLSVYDNQISSLPDSFYTMTQLTHVEINRNNIANISEDISNLTNLQNFHLGDNPLDHIPDALWTMTGMKTLWLTNLGITDIPEGLWNFQYLNDLQLDGNKISLLSGGIKKLTNLKYLYLNDNLLTSLPDEFFDLISIEELYLDHNNILGTMYPFCRTSLGLKSLEIEQPTIMASSHLPFLNFRRLRVFDISYNLFSGEIPGCLTGFIYLNEPMNYLFDFGQHRYNGDKNGVTYNYLDIDHLSSELIDYLDVHFLDENNPRKGRTRQYRSSNLSIDGTIISSREYPRLGDNITLQINYANNGPVKIISGKVYVDIVSGVIITGNSNFDYNTGMLGLKYGEAGDPCFDALYTGSTGAYRNLFETVISGQMGGITIMQRLQSTFGYTGTQVDAGKFFVDKIIAQGGQVFGDISFYNMIKAFAGGLDLATVPNCGTTGNPVYIFDVGDIDIDTTGTILLSGFIVPNFSGTTINNPVSIYSSYDLRVDSNTGNNEQDITKLLSTGNIVIIPSLPDLHYTIDAFEYRGYSIPGNKSIINDATTGTLIGTSAIDFGNISTLIIPIIITSPEENIQAYITSGTHAEFSGAVCDPVLLAPEEYPTSFASGVFGSGYVVKKVFKIGSSCTGSSMIFDQDVEIGVQLATLKTGYIIKSSSYGTAWNEVPAGKNSANANGIVISFMTRHFSYFAIAEPVDGNVIVPPVTPPTEPFIVTHYGGGIFLQKDICPEGDFSPSYYDNICGTKPTTIHNSADTCDGVANELIGAYDFAFAHNITTQTSCISAKLENTIRRKEMAKMVAVFAINIMGMVPNTGKDCRYIDMSRETGEMNTFTKLACQLGLMGYETDGVTQQDEFKPNVFVDRGQFGTILSRILRGTKYAGGKPYYAKHLAALKKENIMTKIDAPRILELRGRVLLTMQRVFEMK